MKLTSLGDVELVRATIILEAAGEPLLGKLAVGGVIRERHESPRWPDTWPGVCLQPKQFSCWNDVPRDGDIPDHIVTKAITPRWDAIWWRECHFAAWGCVYGYYRNPFPGANHYHSEIVRPYWANDSKAKCLGHVGRHLFWSL